MNAICAFFTAYVEKSSASEQYLLTSTSQGFSLEPKSSSTLLRGVKRLCGASYDFDNTATQFLDYLVKNPPLDAFEKKAYLKSCVFLQPICKHVMQKRPCDKTIQLYSQIKRHIKILLRDYSQAKNCQEIDAACSLKLDQIALKLFENGKKPSDTSLEPLLQQACRENKLDLALELVTLSAKPESKELAARLLAHAIQTKKQEAIAILLSTPLDLAYQMQGNSLLHIAAQTLDPDTTRALIARGADVCQKNSAGKVPIEMALHTQQDPTLFYMHLFGDHKLAQEQISTHGIHQFLTNSSSAQSGLGLEIALLFNNQDLARKTAKNYSAQEYLQAQMALAKKYPTSSCKLIAFSHLQIEYKHLKTSLTEIPLPEKEIELDTVYSLYSQFKGTFSLPIQKLEQFIERIKKRIAFKGTPKAGSPGIKTFYETIERALKNILLFFESAANKDELRPIQAAFIREMLASVDLCGGRYFTTMVDQYFKICIKKPLSFEERITRSLAEYRTLCLQSVIDPSKEHNINDYNYFMRMRGRELGIPGFQSYGAFSDEFGFVDIQKTETHFWQLYSPENICGEWIFHLLKENDDLRSDFISWHKEHIPDSLDPDEWLQSVAKLKPYTISYFLCTMTPAICR